MALATFLKAWFFNRRKADLQIAADADALIEIWGDAAYKVAANLSWREDVGILRASAPGHWTGVTLEIGRRLSAQDGGQLSVALKAA